MVGLGIGFLLLLFSRRGCEVGSYLTAPAGASDVSFPFYGEDAPPASGPGALAQYSPGSITTWSS